MKSGWFQHALPQLLLRAGEALPQVRRVRLDGRARQPRMQFEVGELRQPDERRQVVHDEVVHVPLRRCREEPHGLRERRQVVLPTLLVEAPAVDAVRVACHRQRPVPQVRQQVRRDPRVVAEHVALRHRRAALRLRPEHLVHVRHGDLPAAYLHVAVPADARQLLDHLARLVALAGGRSPPPRTRPPAPASRGRRRAAARRPAARGTRARAARRRPSTARTSPAPPAPAAPTSRPGNRGRRARWGTGTRPSAAAPAPRACPGASAA